MSEPALELLIEIRDALRNANRLNALVLDEVRGLRADLAADRSRKRPSTLTAADAAALTVLLPLIAALMGSGRFTVRALMARALEDSGDAVAAREALVSAGIGENARQLGRLLRRAAVADAELGGLYVDGLGSSRDGAVWCVIAETRETRLTASVTSTMRARLDA